MQEIALCFFLFSERRLTDAPESRFLTPALTTVHIHTQIMACEAARLLLSRIRELSLDYRSVYTETYLIERESTLGTGKGTKTR